MKKLFTLILMITMALSIETSGVQAVEVANITGLKYRITEVQFQRIDATTVRLRFRAWGTGDWNGDGEVKSGHLTINQGFDLLIDNSSGNREISGRTVGQIVIDVIGAGFKFKGSVDGLMPGQDSTHGEFQLAVKAAARRGRELNLDIEGVYNRLTNKIRRMTGSGFMFTGDA
ncbi:hypothetical protein ACFL6S_23355 [Candidatus Poribacteria bacterium]